MKKKYNNKMMKAENNKAMPEVSPPTTVGVTQAVLPTAADLMLLETEELLRRMEGYLKELEANEQKENG